MTNMERKGAFSMHLKTLQSFLFSTLIFKLGMKIQHLHRNAYKLESWVKETTSINFSHSASVSRTDLDLKRSECLKVKENPPICRGSQPQVQFRLTDKTHFHYTVLSQRTRFNLDMSRFVMLSDKRHGKKYVQLLISDLSRPSKQTVKSLTSTKINGGFSVHLKGQIA